jgi:hypothetical protein
LPVPAPAYAFSAVLPDKADATALIGDASNVADALLRPNDEIFGAAIVFERLFGATSTSQFDFTYGGDLPLGVIAGGALDIAMKGVRIFDGFSFDDTIFDLCRMWVFGPNINLSIFGEGTFVIGGAVETVPGPSTWAMMLLGFAGLGFARYLSRRYLTPETRETALCKLAAMRKRSALRATWNAPKRSPAGDRGSHAMSKVFADSALRMRRGRGAPQRPESGQSDAEPVTAAPLAFEPCIERCLRERRRSMKVDSCSLGAADPAPATHQRRFREQRRLDRQDIVARHVLCAVDPLQHEHVKDVRILSLLVHSWKLRRETGRVSNAYFESIELRRFGFRIDPTDRPRNGSNEGHSGDSPRRGREQPFMKSKVLSMQWMWVDCAKLRSTNTVNKSRGCFAMFGQGSLP